ncbi:hypothetical [Yersinia pestis KIM10+]|uniref:Uncharacterized protein n=1 Tax=Yersinia pestis TaxID=632 RepID=Q8CLI5_YERPE|nr:hypothetical [Yersinia pestis KIM10+]
MTPENHHIGDNAAVSLEPRELPANVVNFVAGKPPAWVPYHVQPIARVWQ